MNTLIECDIANIDGKYSITDDTVREFFHFNYLE